MSAMSQYLVVLALIVAIANRAYSDTNYRLNVTLKPNAYSIAITPYFDTGDDHAFTFDGEVDITFITEAVTRQIKLHSEDLSYNATNVAVVNGANSLNLNAVNPLEFDKNYTFAFINLQEDLQVGVNYTLKIIYKGPIRADLNGFYRNYYIERGVKKWLGATQMEPTHARKVFPCFDEPDLKATFTLTIDRPASYKPSLANTKIRDSQLLANGYVRERFYPTPILPTYLVAFVVSEFEGVESTFNGTTDEFGVFTRPEAVNQTDYPYDFGMRVVKALGNYFGIDYYSTDANLKLDHVALPDFRAGAMENWGLVTYRESLLLYVPEHSTPYIKYRVAQIVAHETTHMWFGDLVTCHWWSNIWLNEGFANYFQDYITALIEPEVGSGNILVTGSVYSAYDADNSPSSAPITNNNVNSPAEISGHFGTISYQKAGSVIRMIHHLMGDDAFKMGLHSYLETNKFKSVHPEKMYEALELGARNFSALAAYPDTNVAEVMSSWISQPGHPILHVEVNYEDDTVLLTQVVGLCSKRPSRWVPPQNLPPRFLGMLFQVNNMLNKRFYLNSTYATDEVYNIPVTYTTQISPDFNDTKPAFVMKNSSHEFKIANISENHSWVIFNIQETGLYRVNYDDHSWQIISSALQGTQRSNIHHLNRAKIVNDLFAFLFADEVEFERLKEVLEFLSNEEDYSVWYAAIRGFNKLWSYYLGSEALADIESYTLRLLDFVIDKLGYQVRTIDDFETLRNRLQVLEFACKLGHTSCIEHSVELFRGLKENGTEITPSLRPVAYCNGLRSGDASDYDFLWNRMATTNVASEARIISEILGCTSDESSLKSYLVSMLVENSPIKTQDLTVPLSSVLLNYKKVHIVMEELKANYTLWSSIYTSSMDTVLSTVASALHTEEDFTEFEAFLTSCSECTDSAKTSARSALREARATTAWADSHKEGILTSLRSHGANVTPSMAVVVTVAILLEMLQCFL